jgi:ABC-type branched-subunit amino acid transport system permease subunit
LGRRGFFGTGVYAAAMQNDTLAILVVLVILLLPVGSGAIDWSHPIGPISLLAAGGLMSALWYRAKSHTL